MTVSWRHMLGAPIAVVTAIGGLAGCVHVEERPAALAQPSIRAAAAPGEGFGYSYGSGGGYAATVRDK